MKRGFKGAAAFGRFENGGDDGMEKGGTRAVCPADVDSADVSGKREVVVYLVRGHERQGFSLFTSCYAQALLIGASETRTRPSTDVADGLPAISAACRAAAPCLALQRYWRVGRAVLTTFLPGIHINIKHHGMHVDTHLAIEHVVWDKLPFALFRSEASIGIHWHNTRTSQQPFNFL